MVNGVWTVWYMQICILYNISSIHIVYSADGCYMFCFKVLWFKYLCLVCLFGFLCTIKYMGHPWEHARLHIVDTNWSDSLRWTFIYIDIDISNTGLLRQQQNHNDPQQASCSEIRFLYRRANHSCSVRLLLLTWNTFVGNFGVRDKKSTVLEKCAGWPLIGLDQTWWLWY